VLRFKGRAAPCVALTEIDFEALDEAHAGGVGGVDEIG
jgi:hypothetical protein